MLLIAPMRALVPCTTALRLLRSHLISWNGYDTSTNVFRGFTSLPSHTILHMPSLSPTMSQGNLVKWCVKDGDEVTAGSILAEIETDKATLAFENQEEGFIAKLLVSQGTKDIPVGRPLAVLVEDKASIGAFVHFAPGGPKVGKETSAHQAADLTSAKVTASPALYPPHTKLPMPSLSPTMERGNITKWLVKEGDEIRPGVVLAEIETDKATMALENQDDGFIAKLVLPSGSRDITVGTTVAIIVEDKAAVTAFTNYSEGGGGASTLVVPTPPPSYASSTSPSEIVNSRLGPAARMLLSEAGLSRDQIVGTGPKGIITRGDVAAAIAAGLKPALVPKGTLDTQAGRSAEVAVSAATPPAPSSKPAAPTPTAPSLTNYVDTANSQIRKIIASRLLESKVTIPALYVAVDTKLDEAVRLRAMLLDQGIKISLNDLVIKAIATTLAEVPEANVFWDPVTLETKPYASVDVCVAVATPRGLLTPIVKGASKKSLQQISKDVRDLALRARENKLKPEEFQGGSFTVSNLGMMGVANFSAIINPPQAAILAIGTSQQRALIMPCGGPGFETYMTVTLSADHRVYDGELASRLLEVFKGRIENPSKLLID